MKKVLMLFLCSLLLYGCSDDKEDVVITEPTEKPAVEFLTVQIDGYQTTLTAKITSDGGAGIQETGFCYNLSDDGEPSLENVKSEKRIVTYSPGKDYTKVLNLHPEKNYSVVFYAINRNGITYTEAKSFNMPEKDIDLLLPGTYLASKQVSYLSGNIKDYNVQIKNEDGKYFIYGLSCEPLGVSAALSKLELIVEKNNESAEWSYTLTIPYQLTGLNVNFQNNKYPVLLVNGAWLFNDAEPSFDVKGSILYSDAVEVNMTTGYGLVMCDPLTHEIKLDTNYPPVEVVLGPSSYPGDSDQYPRPDCKLIRVIAD